MSESQFNKIPILTGSADYARWALAIKGYSKMFGFWHVLDGQDKIEEVKDEEGKSDKSTVWHEKNDKACGLLLRTTSEDLQVQLDSLEGKRVNELVFDATAFQMWSHLKTKFEKKDGINTVIEFGNLTQLTLSDSEPMEGQLTTLGTQHARLALNKFTLEDHVFTAIILLALPTSFESIKTHFLDGLDDPTSLKVNTVTARIIEKDQRSRTEAASINAVAGPSKAGPGKPNTVKMEGAENPPLRG